MSWRIVVITNNCKLDYKMGYLVVRGEDTKRVFLDEMALLIIENTSVSLTCCLLEALVEKKIRVVFCDCKKSPLAELQPYYGSYDCSRKIETQMSWDSATKGIIWKEIVAEKIRKQAEYLLELGKNNEADLLYKYLTQIVAFDSTNREGHAAKVYFNAVFGMDFTRSEESPINAALNYGYSVILSAVSREIVANGYLTQLGLFHNNMFNHFNLSCDMMEPYRILIDRMVYSMKLTSFDSDEKHSIMTILNSTIIINNSRQTVLNAIKIYVRSVFEAINDKDPSLIHNYTLETS